MTPTRLLLSLALSATITLGARQPAVAAPACAAPLAESGVEINYALPLSDADRDTLVANLASALHDPGARGSWPTPQINSAPSCELATFEADGATWTLSGGLSPAPPRWARAANRTDYIFLAEARGAGLRPTYYLTGVSGGHFYVFRAYAGAPDQAQLVEDVKRLVASQLKAVAIFDESGRALTLALPTASGIQAQLFGGTTQPASLYGADGHFFGDADGGAYQMRGSGFLCPKAIGTQQRSRLIVVNHNDDKLDLGCGFNGGRSWMTIFVTRVLDPTPAKTLFEQRVRDALRSTGVSGSPREAPLDMDMGQVWSDPQGVQQGLWLSRRGQYVIEARGTFPAAEQPGIEAAVLAVSHDLQTQIPDPRR